MRNDDFEMAEKTIKIGDTIFDDVSFAAYNSQNLCNVFRKFFHNKSITKLLELIQDC